MVCDEPSGYHPEQGYHKRLMQAKIDEKLRTIGLSPTGRDFVVKALDPASTIVCSGIPDESTCPVLRPEYTVQVNIPAPSVGTSGWDCMLLFPPGDVTACVYATGPAGIDFNLTSIPPGATNGVVNYLPCVDLPGSNGFQTVGPSGVTSVQRSSRSPTSQALKFRHMFRSATVDLIASAVNDQGDVFASQYPCDLFNRALFGSTVISTATGNPLTFISNDVRVPFNEQDLVLSSRTPYVGRAKDGVYMPMRLTGPSQDFCELPSATIGYDYYDNLPIMGAPFGANQKSQILSFTNNDTGAGGPVPYINNYLGSADVAPNTGFDNSSVGVMIFRNLSGGGGGGFTSSLLVKIISGQEIRPKPTAFDRVYLKPAHIYEPRALEAYYAIAHELDLAYPSRFNSMGAIMSVISSALSHVLPALAAGGKTFLRELIGEEKAAVRVAPASTPVRTIVRVRAPSVARSVSKSATRPRRARRAKVK